MGAKLAAPDRLAINVMGDAAFGMSGLDLETAVREKIPILTIVLNNSALGGYEKHMCWGEQNKFLSRNGSGEALEPKFRYQSTRPGRETLNIQDLPNNTTTGA